MFLPPVRRAAASGTAADALEIEAQRVADEVLRSPLAAPVRTLRRGGAEQVQRSVDDPSIGDRVEHVVAQHGVPLEPTTRRDFEQRFRHDFSRVRVHTGASADASTRLLNARAYTVGTDIVFSAGSFKPGDADGKRLLAHELTHVVQQSTASAADRSTRSVQCAPTKPPSAPSLPIYGYKGTTTSTESLYHYGNLEGVALFSSPPGYPRLTNCDSATSQEEAARYTGTPINDNLLYKYEIKIDSDVFEQLFIDLPGRGAFSEFGIWDKATQKTVQIPTSYFVRVGTLTVSPPSGGSPKGGIGSPAPPVKIPSGGGSMQSTAKRATAAAALAVLGINIGLNWFIGALNERRIKEALDANENDLEAQYHQHPDMGILLLFHFTGEVDSGEGATAAARFVGFTYVAGQSEDNAKAEWAKQPHYETAGHWESAWIPPLAPAAVLPAQWDPIAVGRFADTSKIEFQRVKFAQSGGFGTHGTVGPADLSKSAAAAGFEFVLLRMPDNVPYYGPGGGRNMQSVDHTAVIVGGGVVPASFFDATAVVPVVATNADTLGFFHARGAQGAMEIDDKADALKAIPNIREVRWLRPEQIRIVRKI